MEDENNNTWRLIQNGDVHQFKTLYLELYDNLLLYTHHMGVTHSDGEDIISQVFFKLWENKEKIEIEGSLKGYCFRSVKNAVLNFKNSAKQRYEGEGSDYFEFEKNQPFEEYTELNLEAEDLSTYIEQLTNELPPASQNAFRMSRNDGLTYKEIAELLEISPKTVEKQIGQALAHLRKKLRAVVV
ncbi:RNA polymerase sigma-70 factor [Flammeovirga aprica]|uniref:RNA polymerase sigma-70 factor n=1 Tax=Flammeovirga aprica JL-4 TaxID=694437 RepID=A0A7X9S1D1_9BACT|nr:RNA polymerase sigma-70 factor [Flammeovirga aprica]NME72516.1 RNA polymerase sigma-70 factor [Flammeovirga aprica JL-4]